MPWQCPDLFPRSSEALITSASVSGALNFPKAFPSWYLTELLHSSVGEYYLHLKDEENKALALPCPQLQQIEAE